MIQTLQVGRGVAALAVVLHHAELGVRQLMAPLPAWIAVPFSYGNLGVDFFFVLSGFIIYYINHRQIAEPTWPTKYAEGRLVRVYLPYLPIGMGMALAYTFLPALSESAREWSWLSTITLLPSDAPPALNVAWTLQHEIVFYGIAMLFLYWRVVLWGSLAWAVTIITLHLNGLGGYIGFSLIDLEFLFGMAAAWCFINGKVPRPLPLALGGAAICGCFFLIGEKSYSPLFGLGLALLLLPLVRMEAAGRIKATGSALLLGNASYSLYLIHPSVISLSVRLFREDGIWIALGGSIACALVAGIVYHKYFEQPGLHLTRKWLQMRRKPPLAQPSPVDVKP